MFCCLAVEEDFSRFGRGKLKSAETIKKKHFERGVVTCEAGLLAGVLDLKGTYAALHTK